MNCKQGCILKFLIDKLITLANHSFRRKGQRPLISINLITSNCTFCILDKGWTLSWESKKRLLDYYVLLGSYFIENPIKYIKGPQCSWFDGKRGLTSFTHINHGLYRGVMNKNRPNCYCWVNFSHFSIQYSLVLHQY